MFDMPDHRLNPRSSAEAFSRLTAQGRCVSLSRWAWCQKFCVAHLGATPVAWVAGVHLGTGSRDLPCLLQHFGQRIAVMDVFREGQCSDDDARVLITSPEASRSISYFSCSLPLPMHRTLGSDCSSCFVLPPLLLNHLEKFQFIFMPRKR